MQKFKPFEKTRTPSPKQSQATNGAYRGSDPPSPTDDPLDRLSRVRAELKSVTDDEEDTGRITIPSDAPPRAKLILGFASGLTPTGRLIIGLAIIAAIVLLVLRGVKLF